MVIIDRFVIVSITGRLVRKGDIKNCHIVWGQKFGDIKKI